MKLLYKNYLIVLLLAATLQAAAQTGDEAAMQNQAKARDKKEIDKALNGWWKASMQTHDSRIQWWRDARFGMFIHWGVYSLPGGEWKGKKVDGYAEHLMRKEKIPRAEYLQLAHQFSPVKFNADVWVQTAKRAGMRYIIITAKHHDGFAMFNSQVTDYNVVKQSAWKHDPMADLSAACKKYGLKFGFYYSHAFDWEHPDAPGNDWDYDNPGGDKLLHGGANWYDVHPELLPKAVNYVNEKAIPQIRELLQMYHPDILWFDTPSKLPLSENVRILEAIRQIDPNVVVNGRLARGAGNLNLGDYKNTADRPAEFYPADGDWEAIPTTNESYGYSKFDHSHKPASFFITLLAKAASRGGNLLMNIGPKGDGEFDAKDVSILDSIGRWMDVNGQSIYKTQKTPLAIQYWGVSTLKDNRLYLQVFNWPSDHKLVVAGLKNSVTKAYLLADAGQKALPVKRINPLDLEIELPGQAPDKVSSVIVLQTNVKIETDTARLLASHTITNRLLAFDAELKGGGFRFGDGKAGKYYVENWKALGQTVNWNFRLADPGKFKVLVKYTADNANGGTYEFKLDDFRNEGIAESSAKGESVKENQHGVISLGSGYHHLQIAPVKLSKQGLMKLLEVQLIPVDAQ
ncbi:alpha-L-fucosidase [Mucilaginibacter yixingensis]|uniref:alpha-L-fucosidase n=1 Tax=Mucilaginibacter yixingensis TaxID=1295612 RepID=A0A2T5JGJ9_9SPHI|nr:alpha-L-fucosidase [Mucilaginibacter yixingensis]PTR01545.1 alpha-L-fucosidase [Mucilaginibacter yixingensis]